MIILGRGYILWLGEVRHFPPSIVNLIVFLLVFVLLVGLFSTSLLASCFNYLSSSLFLFVWLCLIYAQMPDWGRAFVHGHTFLHSRSDDIGSQPAAWSYYVSVQSYSCSLSVIYMTLVVGNDTYEIQTIIIIIILWISPNVNTEISPIFPFSATFDIINSLIRKGNFSENNKN